MIDAEFGWLKGGGADDEEDEKPFYGVVTGRVINLLDPLGLGRIQVQLPFIDSVDLMPWARIAAPFAGFFSGDYFIPDPGTEVLVAFEHGKIDHPYIIGCLWNTIERPPLPTPVPQIRALRTLAGNQIVFTEVPPSLTIQSGPTPPAAIPAPATPTTPPPSIMLSPAGVTITSPTSITLTVGTSNLTILPEGILLVAREISISGVQDLTLFGAQVFINPV